MGFALRYVGGIVLLGLGLAAVDALTFRLLLR